MAFNMFAFPAGYFEEKTPQELGISAEARCKLISMQNTKTDIGNPEERQRRRIEEFLKDFKD